MGNKVIEINNLTKMYGKHRGVENVTFSIKEGEVFGFIGPNGAGKSTTIRTLLGLITATEGECKIFGKDSKQYAKEIAKDIGYLPSEVFYYDGMKVKDLLNYSASFYKKDCSTRIKELAEFLELDLNKKIDDLSYGNRKKVGIVQGLLHSPKLIILDEPTGGLDPLMQQKFFDLLKQENEKGATILFSSHILTEIQKMCDRVAIIKDGKLVKVDTVESLREDNYKKYKIHLNDISDESKFDIDGISEKDVQNNVVSFIYNGDINNIINIIANIKITDLIIEEPDLEEVFMHFYE